MEPAKYTVPILKRLLKEHGVRDYSGKIKAELIVMLQASKPHPIKRASPPPPPSPPESKKPPKKKMKRLKMEKSVIWKADLEATQNYWKN